MAERLHVRQSFVSKMECGGSYVDVLAFIDWRSACGVRACEVRDRFQAYATTQITT